MEELDKEFLSSPDLLDEVADEIDRLQDQNKEFHSTIIDTKLPGELELQLAIEKGEWPHTMDAMIWADMFCKHFPEFDHSIALGWFANAIMAGYDTAMSRQEKLPIHESD